MRIVGNFDSTGGLEKLHLNPREECNLDAATNKRELEWEEALMELFNSVAIPETEDAPEGYLRDSLCQNCDFRATVESTFPSHAYCDNCKKVQPVRLADFEESGNNQVAADVVCNVCAWVVATMYRAASLI